MKEFDDKFRVKLCRAIYIVTALIYLYTAGFGSFSEMTQRALLVAICGFTIFLRKPLKIKGTQTGVTRILDWFLAFGFTGAFTIPLMKSTGYQDYEAGAVEAVRKSSFR